MTVTGSQPVQELLLHMAAEYVVLPQNQSRGRPDCESGRQAWIGANYANNESSYSRKVPRKLSVSVTLHFPETLIDAAL